MERTKTNNPNSTKEEKNLFALLDKGINDMEEGRELPLEEAFHTITQLRNQRRRAKA